MGRLKKTPEKLFFFHGAVVRISFLLLLGVSDVALFIPIPVCDRRGVPHQSTALAAVPYWPTALVAVHRRPTAVIQKS